LVAKERRVGHTQYGRSRQVPDNFQLLSCGLDRAALPHLRAQAVAAPPTLVRNRYVPVSAYVRCQRPRPPAVQDCPRLEKPRPPCVPPPPPPPLLPPPPPARRRPRPPDATTTPAASRPSDPWRPPPAPALTVAAAMAAATPAAAPSTSVVLVPLLPRRLPTPPQYIRGASTVAATSSGRCAPFDPPRSRRRSTRRATATQSTCPPRARPSTARRRRQRVNGSRPGSRRGCAPPAAHEQRMQRGAATGAPAVVGRAADRADRFERPPPRRALVAGDCRRGRATGVAPTSVTPFGRP